MKALVRIFAIAGLLLCGPVALALEGMRVDGLGWMGDRRMEERLAFLLGYDGTVPLELNASLLEDSAFLLLEQMQRQGYLKPEVAGIFRSDAEELSAVWTVPYDVQLPIEYLAGEARFVIEKGLLYYYADVRITGLEAIDLKQPERFFIPGGSLISRRSDLAYTSENFKRRRGRLLATLEAMGYVNARVASESILVDEETGAVGVDLAVDVGSLHRIGEVEVFSQGPWPEAIERVTFEEGELFTRDWLRDARLRILHAAYAAGYAEAEVLYQLKEVTEGRGGDAVQPVQLELRPGSRYTLVVVGFEGDTRTKPSVLRRQANLDRGGPLDPREADRGRRRLLGLGIYRQVEMSYVPVGETERSVVYDFKPGTLKELQLAGGWGSYEQARAGFRWTHRNPFGRAHRYTVRAKQSFKATRLQSTYNLPQLFGTSLEAYAETEYTTREEISFDRSRQGGLVGVSSSLGDSGWRLGVEYGWFAEEADGIAGSTLATEADAFVASVGVGLSLDRRDDPLAPTSGYDLFANLKTAHQELGGNVNFQRIQIGGSYHRPLSSRTIAHLGLRGGLLAGSDGELPFGERFFLGGENTVRGYKEGEASPLNPSGEPIGAEAFWRANLELEERILSDVSLVVFLDAVGVSRDGGFSGNQEVLTSAGLGFRYQTVVGPLRLEYGHNMNRRELDRSGRLHFSIGYPF